MIEGNYKNKRSNKGRLNIRSPVNYENLAYIHNYQKVDLRKGDQYGSGIGVDVARKFLRAVLKQKIRPKKTWTHIYHHQNYCTATGNKCVGHQCIL